MSVIQPWIKGRLLITTFIKRKTISIMSAIVKVAVAVILCCLGAFNDTSASTLKKATSSVFNIKNELDLVWHKAFLTNCALYLSLLFFLWYSHLILRAASLLHEYNCRRCVLATEITYNGGSTRIFLSPLPLMCATCHGPYVVNTALTRPQSCWP
jgi:hypothetical protein